MSRLMRDKFAPVRPLVSNRGSSRSIAGASSSQSRRNGCTTQQEKDSGAGEYCEQCETAGGVKEAGCDNGCVLRCAGYGGEMKTIAKLMVGAGVAAISFCASALVLHGQQKSVSVEGYVLDSACA